MGFLYFYFFPVFGALSNSQNQPYEKQPTMHAGGLFAANKEKTILEENEEDEDKEEDEIGGRGSYFER